MGTGLKTLFILLFIASSHLTGEEVKLLYKSHDKAIIKTEVETAIEMKIGSGTPLLANGIEKVEAEVEVISDKPFVDSLPLSLSYTLLDYQAELKQGDNAAKFNINDPGTDFLYGEMRMLQKKPALLELSSSQSGFVPKEALDPLAEALKSPKVTFLLLNRLREAFFLVGEDLKVGKVIEVALPFGEKTLQSGKMKFTITKITDTEVEADILFTVPRQRSQEDVILVSSGEANGKAFFTRQNALNFRIELEGQFGSSMKANEDEAQSQKIDIKMKVHGASL